MRITIGPKALIALALVAVAAVAAVGYASIPDSNGIVHTCFSKAQGTWRPIDYPDQQCRSGETQLDLYSTQGANATFVKNGDAAGGDLTGTYPNPTIGAGKVTTSKIADGAITTSKFDPSAKAPDADKLDGLDSTAFLRGYEIACAGVSVPQFDESCDSFGHGVSDEFLTLPGDWHAFRVVTACPTGKRATGGGVRIFPDPSPPDEQGYPKVISSSPATVNGVHGGGWLTTVGYPNNNENWVQRPYAVCVAGG